MRITCAAGIGLRLWPSSFWNMETGPNWLNRSSVLPLIGPSVAMPTWMPAARMASTGAMPRPAFAFERALWATRTSGLRHALDLDRIDDAGNGPR